MKTFKELVQEDLKYNRMLKKSQEMHDKAKAAGIQTVKINGEKYSMVYKDSAWQVTDSDGDYVVNLNVRAASKAKKELKLWLNS
jgi:hypothetical protein